MGSGDIGLDNIDGRRYSGGRGGKSGLIIPRPFWDGDGVPKGARIQLCLKKGPV